MKSQLMLTPGPVHIPDEILAAMQISDCHHRSEEFQSRMLATAERYQELVRSELLPVFLAGTGTLGMEACMRSAFSPGDTIIFVSAGKFGERFGVIGERLGLNMIELRADYGSSPKLEDLEGLLTKHTDLAALCLQHSETSTGVLHPAKEMIALCKRISPSALSIVDGITSIGVTRSDHEHLGCDVMISGSQKALMLPPGMTMVSFSARALSKMEATANSSLYMDIPAEYASQLEGKSCWTSPTHLILGLDASLKRIFAEGLESVWSRHLELAQRCRAELIALGCSLFSQGEINPGLTAFEPSAGTNVQEFRTRLWQEESLRIAGGQGVLKPRIARVGHMGAVDMEMLEDGLGRISRILT